MSGRFEVGERSAKGLAGPVDAVFCHGCGTLLLRGRLVCRGAGERIICMECGHANSSSGEWVDASSGMRQKDALVH